MNRIRRITAIPKPPPRPADSHKGTYGTLLVLGGSPDMIGAPMLAARSAYRAGCGLVRVAMPRPVLAAALTLLPEAVGLGLEGDAAPFADALAESDAVAAGPGLGGEPAAGDLLDAVVEGGRPAVIDADALNLLAARAAMPRFTGPAVLTPHPGEMRRLLAHVGGFDDVPSDDAGREALAAQAASAWGVVVVLKGRRTVVSDGDWVYANATGDATLAKAGSGDVLAGLIGSLLAQGMDARDAAVLGTHAHGLAGERVGRSTATRGGLASEVADAVGAALNVPTVPA